MLKQAVAPPDLVATPMGPKLPSQRAVDLVNGCSCMGTGVHRFHALCVGPVSD